MHILQRGPAAGSSIQLSVSLHTHSNWNEFWVKKKLLYHSYLYTFCGATGHISLHCVKCPTAQIFIHLHLHKESQFNSHVVDETKEVDLAKVSEH